MFNTNENYYYYEDNVNSVNDEDEDENEIHHIDEEMHKKIQKIKYVGNIDEINDFSKFPDFASGDNIINKIDEETNNIYSMQLEFARKHIMKNIEKYTRCAIHCEVKFSITIENFVAIGPFGYLKRKQTFELLKELADKFYKIRFCYNCNLDPFHECCDGCNYIIKKSDANPRYWNQCDWTNNVWYLHLLDKKYIVVINTLLSLKRHNIYIPYLCWQNIFEQWSPFAHHRFGNYSP